MKGHSIPLLGYALLGLVDLKPSSGYDLRKIFAESAMGNYSSSPGAIYPALERLEKGGLIQGTVEETAGMRRRRLYRVTPPGGVELRKWLARPIQPNDVLRGAGELMLRFSFMDHALGAGACIEFLGGFRAAIAAYVTELDTYLSKNAPQMPLSARLALESGIGGYRGMHEWTEHALREYRKTQSVSLSRTPENTD